MKIYNNPSTLTYEEKFAIKQAQRFFDRRGLILTNNGVWWYCSDIVGAKEYLKKNGAEEINYEPPIK